jgi:hypothetical protein
VPTSTVPRRAEHRQNTDRTPTRQQQPSKNRRLRVHKTREVGGFTDRRFNNREEPAGRERLERHLRLQPKRAQLQESCRAHCANGRAHCRLDVLFTVHSFSAPQLDKRALKWFKALQQHPPKQVSYVATLKNDSSRIFWSLDIFSQFSSMQHGVGCSSTALPSKVCLVPSHGPIPLSQPSYGARPLSFRQTTGLNTPDTVSQGPSGTEWHRVAPSDQSTNHPTLRPRLLAIQRELNRKRREENDMPRKNDMQPLGMACSH